MSEDHPESEQEAAKRRMRAQGLPLLWTRIEHNCKLIWQKRLLLVRVTRLRSSSDQSSSIVGVLLVRALPAALNHIRLHLIPAQRSASPSQEAPPQQSVPPQPVELPEQTTAQAVEPQPSPQIISPQAVEPPQQVVAPQPVEPVSQVTPPPPEDAPQQPVESPPQAMLPEPSEPQPEVTPPSPEIVTPQQPGEPVPQVTPLSSEVVEEEQPGEALPEVMLPQPVEPPQVTPPLTDTREPEEHPAEDQGAGGNIVGDSLDGAQGRDIKRGDRPQDFAPRPAPQNVRSRARRAFRRTRRVVSFVFFLICVATGSGLGYTIYNFVTTTQITHASQVLTLRDLLPSDNLKIYDSQGNLIDQLTDQGIHTEVTYDQIAPMLVNATVAIEDRSFWSNNGIDLTGILRSALTDLQNGQPIEGGSTITQQLVKQLIVGSSPNMTRKFSEIAIAPQITDHYSKRDIMEMYLNTIYYGHLAYGIDAAATVYFGLQDANGESAASQLDLAQAAMLAGLPRNASLYDPFTYPQSATSRFLDVLNALAAQGYISRDQADAAYQEEQRPNFFKFSPTLQDQAPHFDNYVLSQLEQMFHLTRDQLSRSGLAVYTTLNTSLQQSILTVMQQHIAGLRDTHHVTNAAEVLIDFHTGAIISMLGSVDYYSPTIDGQFNVALAYRQPGSSFKPYVYATAFQQGASPAQAIDDAPTTFNTPGATPPTYTPHNDDSRFHGHMTLRCALQNSLNVPAVRVLQHVGIANVMTTAQEMGITSYQGTPGLSLALGSLDVRLLDQTSAMGVFANSGVREPYYSISEVVQNSTGKVLFQHQSTPGAQVITPQLAYMMTNVLSDNTSRIPVFSKCNVLQLYSDSRQACLAGNRGTVRPAAAKTGTTQDLRDGWTVGYTTDYVMGVWTGNDDNTPMRGVTAETSAAPIWHDAMLLAEQGLPIRDFQNPGGLVRATVTYPDGVKITDWFLPGTVPHNQPRPTHGSHQPSAVPYCSTYSFAFSPPRGNGIPANGDWW